MNCPVCGSSDYVEFVFAAHYRDGERFTTNPADFHRVFICDSLHVFDEDGLTVKMHSEEAEK